jgi:hypothetical protein
MSFMTAIDANILIYACDIADRGHNPCITFHGRRDDNKKAAIPLREPRPRN